MDRNIARKIPRYKIHTERYTDISIYKYVYMVKQ